MFTIKNKENLDLVSVIDDKNSVIKENICLKEKNWFKTGGKAKYYAEPQNEQDFIKLLSFTKDNKHEIFVLGEGANILISDEGFDGLVIKPQLKNIFLEHINENEVLVTVGSGVNFQNLIDHCLENQLIGLEEFSGIPGTVGGSVYINIHYFEFLLSQFLVNATVIQRNSSDILKVDNNWFNFSYNNSTLLQKNYFLIDATFKLKKVDNLKAYHAKGRRDEIIRHRTKRYPNYGTCGSFFRNFTETEVTQHSSGKKMIYIAYYLDKIGVKGILQVGDAIVSYQHANMIVNLGKATSSDIINLAKQMQQLVKDNFNIIPQPECQLIGFKEYPLLKP